MTKYPRVYVNGMDTSYFNAWTVGEDGVHSIRNAVKADIHIEMSRHIAFDIDTHLTQGELNDFDALCAKIGQRIIDEFAATIESR